MQRLQARVEELLSEHLVPLACQKPRQRAGPCQGLELVLSVGYTAGMITIEPHRLLHLHAFLTRFPRPLGELPSSAELRQLLRLDASVAPGDVSYAFVGTQAGDDRQLREAVRALLRLGGFKPTGRSKPASEYLLRAATDGSLSSINLAVDLCNVVSLHSGLPISVVDVDRLAPGDLRVAIAPPGASYVFNASGQAMDLGGLLCLFDAIGPCANAVKDSQRTKTSATTTTTLSLIWGTNALPGLTERVADWYHQLTAQAGAQVEVIQ